MKDISGHIIISQPNMGPYLFLKMNRKNTTKHEIIETNANDEGKENNLDGKKSRENEME